MKKIFFLAACTFIAATSVNAQQGFYVGVRGAAASTWLFNQNVSNTGASMDYKAAFGYNYGVDVRMEFNDHVGIMLNVLQGVQSEGYSGKIGLNGNTNYTSTNTLNELDIPVLFRYKSKGAYLEIGPEYQMINSAIFSSSLNSGNVDESNVFATSNIAAVLGFGVDSKLSDHLYLTAGLRFAYGLTDLKGVDGLGQDLSNSFNYPKYYPTNSAYGALEIGLVYKLGAAAASN
ncbi:MAG TPA: outer membrane beta-barrel protein [Bacteroidia bacterium]|nr:outer membrane beta-barrel protein [Bacteroidia bacterium]